MSIKDLLIRKQPHLKPYNKLGCYLPFIEYDKQQLLGIQEKYSHSYVWYYENLAHITNSSVDENRFKYKILSNHHMNSDPYFVNLSKAVREKIPLLKEISFHYRFVKFSENYELETHIDIGRNAVIFFPLTEGGSSTDFYRNNKLIKSFDHVSPLLLAVDIPHGSRVTKEKITFQIGFTYPDWHELLDFVQARFNSVVD